MTNQLSTPTWTWGRRKKLFKKREIPDVVDFPSGKSNKSQAKPRLITIPPTNIEISPLEIRDVQVLP
jgi:hypothetical protein